MKVAVIGAGAMGSAVGATLAAHGAKVLTPLAGRSAATRARAEAANMRDASVAECAQCDVALSIVASPQALPVAQAFAHIADRRAVFVDCNAIQPAKVRAIADLLGNVGVADAGIVGGPPAPDGSRGPLFYVSGPDAAKVLALADYGLAFEHLDAPVGAASALKLCFAGTSKGQSALLAMMTLLAVREGVKDAFLEQLAQTNAGFLEWGGRQAQRLGQVSARWADEMAEIARFGEGLTGDAEEFTALETFYAALAEDPASTALLKKIFET
ncbi:MAG: NAD(P)-binding domain-containing protein [Candidatus Andeanibacterium colombiense]|uniref:NAD(P)-binding domain-containing protein n=1 Tax=Candidatus Andeanibacterium colombiense TaxID=3121345 RepID=A0AAJ5X614_9SPHN|nr:MAG: NAD(P)-binding domain-containing protein [Sphingomonadaceae bacterium]